MSQKIAVAIIHGVGSQGPDFADKAIEKLSRAFAKHLPDNNKSVEDKLVLMPIYWADILSQRQRILWQTVEDDAHNKLNFELTRKFFLAFGGDAIAYQPGATRREVYDQIHQTVTNVFSQLASAAGPQAPLCIIAHSIGTVIIHNFLFDLTSDIEANTLDRTIDTPLEKGETLTLFYTLGSPLAVWSLRYQDYRPITFPGSQIPTLYPKAHPKWINYYDKDDILAYPVCSLSTGHKALARQGILRDVEINAGSFLTSWNPLAHTAYWTDNDVVKPVAKDLFETWQAVNA